MIRHATAVVAAVAASVALCACGSQSSPGAAVRAWASAGSFDQSVRTLLADSTGLEREIAHHRPALNIKTACAELFDDANGSNTDELPAPDAKLTTLLAAAYDDLVQASARCVHAPSDAAVLTKVDRERHRAVGLLVAAVLREEAVAGRSLGIQGIP